MYPWLTVQRSIIGKREEEARETSRKVVPAVVMSETISASRTVKDEAVVVDNEDDKDEGFTLY